MPFALAFASEPAVITDAGADGATTSDAGSHPGDGGAAGGDGGISTDAGPALDSGAPAQDDGGPVGAEEGGPPSSKGSSSGGCGCRVARRAGGTLAFGALAPLLVLALRRRRR